MERIWSIGSLKIFWFQNAAYWPIDGFRFILQIFTPETNLKWNDQYTEEATFQVEEQEQDYCGLRRWPVKKFCGEVFIEGVHLKTIFWEVATPWSVVVVGFPNISSTFVVKQILQEWQCLFCEHDHACRDERRRQRGPKGFAALPPKFSPIPG